MEAITKVDPKEYGLQDEQAQSIEQAFMPKIIERDGLKNVYESLLTQEMSPELSKQAGDLRRMLVKVRTGFAEIHRTQKAFYLAAGRYVDAWKNKETLPVEQMEENLSKIEKHYENIEIERKAKLRAERLEELLNFDIDGRFAALEEMSPEVWNTYLEGVKLQFNQKKELERKADEERIAAEKAEAAERERIKAENELLKKAAEEAERQAELDRKMRAKRSEELRPYIIFIRDYNAMIAMPEKEYKKELAEIKIGAQQHYEHEEKARKEKEKLDQQIREEQEFSRIAAEEASKEVARLEAEIKAKDEAERKVKEAQEKAAKKQALAPDKDKLLILAREIKNMQVPEVRSGEAAAIIANTRDLLTKTANYIIEKAEQL